MAENSNTENREPKKPDLELVEVEADNDNKRQGQAICFIIILSSIAWSVAAIFWLLR